MAGGEMAGGEMAGGEMAGGYVDINQLEWSDMCVHWNRTWDRVEQVRWTGSTAQCDPGMLNDEALESAVELTNLYRGLAGLSPITLNRSISNDLQACALMMDANNSLSHQPPETWSCFSSNGAYMASQSNIAGSSAIDAIGMYMIDPGNQTTIGHRRWLLSLGLESVGIGSTDNYSCMAVLHLNRPRGWVAFPSPGPFPVQAMVDRWGRSVDQVGWTFQYDGFNLSDPQVSITAYSANESEGEALAVNVVTLRPNFGSSQALNMIPQGWQSEIGKRYEVKIVAGDESFEYAVDFVDCDQVR